MTQDPAGTYEQLLTLGVCALELARAGRLTELAACQKARAGVMASLPAIPPAHARLALERCALLEGELAAELRRGRSAVLEALAGVRRAQRAADGYAPARAPQRLISADA
jgi:hypothetical protein